MFFLIGAVSAQEDTNVSLSTDNINDVEDVISSDNLVEEIADTTDDVDDEDDELKATDDSSLQSEDNDSSLSASDSPVLSDSSNAVGNSSDDSKDEIIQTKFKSPDYNVVKGKEFHVKLVDGDGKALADKTVTFVLKGKTTKVKTDEKGIAKLKMDVAKGTYTVKYSFSQKGYEKATGSQKVIVITSTKSVMKLSNYVAYAGIVGKYYATLTVDGMPLPGRHVTFKLNGKTYKRTTNAKGKALLSFKLAKGTYKISCSYDGYQNIKKSTGTAKITVKKGMPTKIIKANDIVYKDRISNPFKVKVVDAKGHAVPNKVVIFKVNGKTYKRTTNAKGIATLTIKLPEGQYKLKAYSTKTSLYNKSKTKTFGLKVYSKFLSYHGIWLFAADMKKVNLQQLAKNHVGQIFVNQICVDWYGQSYVESFVKRANSYGINVHLWMQVFYWGKWLSPVSKSGKYNYDLINSKVKEATKFAKIKGIAGVHFDYVRFPGTAYQYKNAANAVNYFVKKASTAIHKVNSKLIVSAAIMPEPSSMKYYYGQDVPTMSKYVDVLMPMVYKGNYNAGRSWIKSTTKTFVSQSQHAKIWTGLQSYKSDSNVVKLSSSELKKDMRAALSGGAQGVILFRYGLFNLFDFSRL